MIELISVGERGLIVSFGKEDLLAIKEGKTLHGELVGANGKTPLLFMRDRTFRDMKAKFDKSAKAGVVRDQIASVAVEADALGQDIGSAEKVEG